jgi:hypothetical protein
LGALKPTGGGFLEERPGWRSPPSKAMRSRRELETKKSEIYRAQIEEAQSIVRKFPEWMRQNVTASHVRLEGVVRAKPAEDQPKVER